MSDFAPDIQASALDAIIELFSIDASVNGAGIYHFVSGPLNGQAVQFGGITYAALPIEISGLRQGGDGAPARPQIKISNVYKPLLSANMATESWRGATVTRIRTFKKHLDGQAQADPHKHFPLDIYRIEQKTGETKTEIVWELVSGIDFENQKLPKRQIVRDVCNWRYRRWGGTAFDYSKADCPYVGDAYYNTQDEAVDDPALDKCSRRLSGCKARFGNEDLPFGGFAGVARGRV